MKPSTHPMRLYRATTGRSLDEIAVKVGTTRAWLSRIERGEQASPELIRKLVAETGLGADAFLKPVEASA